MHEEISEVIDELLAGRLTRAQARARLISSVMPLPGDPGQMAASEPEPEPLPEPKGASGIADLGFARVDLDRARRKGFPEVVFAAGKTPDQCAAIVAELAARHPNILCTRAEPAHFEAVSARLVEAEYDSEAGVIYLWRDRSERGSGTVRVVSAGTSDRRVVAEAERCLRVMGNAVERIEDVGVAGLARVLSVAGKLAESSVIVCVAGMEGALPSVVSGLVPCPVIAVPTSVGYGATFGGVTAMLGSLAACAPGVTVVNIDNGFGAAYAASAMNRIPTPIAELDPGTAAG